MIIFFHIVNLKSSTQCAKAKTPNTNMRSGAIQCKGEGICNERGDSLSNRPCKDVINELLSKGKAALPATLEDIKGHITAIFATNESVHLRAI